MAATKHDDKGFWLAVSCACLAFGLLVMPNYDDGNYFYQLYNTLALRNPFYNDLFGQYFHFMKPTMLLYALVSWGSGFPSYRLIALVQAGQILLCSRLLYLCCRRYASREAARAGVCVFLCLLAPHWALSAMRPETTIVLCCAAVFWLCERFLETGAVSRLIAASALALLVALPMHTCGVIACLYLGLFVVASWQRLWWKPLLGLVLASCAFGAAGAAILIYPGMGSFVSCLALFSFDGNRFSGLAGEYARIRAFASDPFFSSTLLLMAAVLLAGAAGAGWRRWLQGLRSRRTVSLLFAAVVLGLGVLPAAMWEIYMVYYCLPLALGFAMACDACNRRSRPVLLALALAAAGALALGHAWGSTPQLYVGLCAAGFLLAVACAWRMPAARLSLLVVVPLLAYQAVALVSTKIIYDRAAEKIGQAGGVVLASGAFVFFGDNVVAVNGDECGARTEIIPPAPGTESGSVILHPVAEGRIDRISRHPLIGFFNVSLPALVQPQWSTPRRFGPVFYGLSAARCSIAAFLARQSPTLRYSAVKTTPLSSPALDQYSRIEGRDLCFNEYRLIPPTP